MDGFGKDHSINMKTGLGVWGIKEMNAALLNKRRLRIKEKIEHPHQYQQRRHYYKQQQQHKQQHEHQKQ